MPAGNLAPASPSGVFPKMTYTSFEEGRLYPGLFQNLHDGTPLASLITDGMNNPESIRTYSLAARLTASAIATLRTFYEAHADPPVAFYWYQPFEVEPGNQVGSNYDATGVSTQGRHTVYFLNASWSETTPLGRSNTSFAFFETA
jgi:phage-related protein